MEQVAPDPNKAFDAAIQTVEDEWTMVRPISAGAALGPAVLEENRNSATWERMHDLAQELWRISCAITVTPIWRWNVDQIHGRNSGLTLEGALRGLRSALLETHRRYVARLLRNLGRTSI
ncbi:hypothetical protein PI125_g6459 [Phytophthora idaei]|nr:hypothetical protein PI125_g6459 [Phytophthora idaei]